MKVFDVYSALNRIAPFDTAYEWDNCGLITGSFDDSVTGVLVTLDADFKALENAIKNNCSVVVSHHPVIWDPLKSVTDKDTVYHYIKNKISVISAHTCLDACESGPSYLLAKIAGVENPAPYTVDGLPIGRTGSVNFDENFVSNLASALNTRADSVICRPVKNVCVIAGSGGSEIKNISQHEIDTLITGECKHEHFVYAENYGLNIIALGHFETENIVVKPLAKQLEKMLDIPIFTSSRTPLVNRG